ncbi:MAG TPA: hypothetical protein VJ044_00285, partial [Candidatus Hodarchaeales archaeon]|nr:hypothetical protein [Candidatus Hodarchaeales archaeon]
VQATVSAGIDVLNPRVTLLESLEKVVRDSKFPSVNSLPVIGLGDALHTIDHYLDNFKAIITLLIPNPRDIPVKRILDTKRPKRVTIASMFDMDSPVDKDIVKQLAAKDNVTVRRLDKEQFSGAGGEYVPLYIVAERDTEEMVFGSQDAEKKAEFTGIVSQNLSYIKFIGRLVLSDFMTKAKKVESTA